MKTITLIAAIFFSVGVVMAQGRMRPNTNVKPIKLENTKTTTSTGSPAVDQTVYSGIKGTVHVSTSCATYIEVSEKGVPAKYYPLNLPAEFEKEGAKIVFDYVQEASKYPSNCGFTKAISVNNVKRQQLRETAR